MYRVEWHVLIDKIWFRTQTHVYAWILKHIPSWLDVKMYPSTAPTENTQRNHESFFVLLPVRTEVMSVSTMCKYRSEEGKHTRGAVSKLKRGYWWFWWGLRMVGKDLLVLNGLCGLFLFMWVHFLCTSCIKIDHT